MMTEQHNPKPRIGIIGGGPAGLSMARLLSEKGDYDITIFEALPQVGGKSYTVYQGDIVAEMGTCYATFSHKITNRWMKQLRMKMTGMGEQVFDGKDFVKYVKTGSGPSLLIQILRYRGAKAKLEKELAKTNPAQWALEDAAKPVAEWLQERNLGKIENFMHRSTTNIAYGFVNEVPTVHALRWNDMKLIITGVLKQLKMPVAGWAEFWKLIAADFDVRLETRIEKVERSDAHVMLTTTKGETHVFDEVVCAIAIDEFTAMTTATEDEKYVSDSVTWNGYTTTLFASEDWFTGPHIQAFREAVIPGAKLGKLMGARRDGYEKDLGGHLYLAGQLSGDYTGEELIELLKADLAEKGATISNVVIQKMWKYQSTYSQQSIRDGIIQRLRDMQGAQSTWYTGATFSHEAVSHIVNFNAELVSQIHKTVQKRRAVKA